MGATKKNGIGGVAWQAPPEGCLKLNVDASIVNDGWVGLGMVLRDYGGRVILVGSRRCWARWAPTVAELKALAFGMEVAKRFGYTQVIAESDNLIIIDRLRLRSIANDEMDLALEDVDFICRSFKSITWSHVKRDGNEVAHHLARVISMCDEQVWVGSCANHLSWPKTLVKKWFNIKDKAEDFHADDVLNQGCEEEWINNNHEERETCSSLKKKRLNRRSSDRARRSKVDFDPPQVTDLQNYRVFVATWNVAGKSPPSQLNLEEWLHTSPPADIYVLGFQEIVPLNAGNVLGTEDNGPARKWLSLIRRTLNNLPGSTSSYHTPSPVPDPIVELDADFETSTMPKNSSFFHRRSFQTLSRSMRVNTDISDPQPRLDRRFSVCGGDYDPNYRWCSSDDENPCEESLVVPNCSPTSYYNGFYPMEECDSQRGQSKYCLVASKQMVGIFLTVWVRSDLRDDVKNMKVSCVGRGLMGYLGNKGSISISMSLHRTSFCFVCSHLTSGEKEGDEVRRNSDVMEILRKTRFPRVQGTGDEYSPQTILDHDRVIWLGDLNYRISLSYRCAKALVEMRNWKALLENDQLRIEQRRGRVFEGWREGKIYFPPTYKYTKNSDRYAGADTHQKQKRRTPAWCDRILWHGKGLRQLSYVRGESRFSDHRPVYSVFLAEVESSYQNRLRKSMSCSSARVQVEELLPPTYGYHGFNFY